VQNPSNCTASIINIEKQRSTPFENLNPFQL
jgi:hypothetical protein